MLEAKLRGVCSTQFEPVIDLLDHNLQTGVEAGVSMYIDIDGHTVLDVWGGYSDAARTSPWQESTITNLWSVSKSVTNLAAMMLVAHGELNVDSPVCHYWPEFEQAGKRDVLVRHVLSHTAGLPGWERPLAPEQLYDRELATQLLAAQSPWWKPGAQVGLHVLTQGYIVGELIHRVTGLPLETFVAEQVVAPLEADFQYGVRDEDLGRVAEVLAPPYPLGIAALSDDDVRRRTLSGSFPAPQLANTDGWRSAVVGAANGHSNARGLARLMSVITLGGEASGSRLLSERTVQKLFCGHAGGHDLVLDLPMRYGLGYALPSPEVLPFLPEGRVAFSGCWGGALVVMDLDRRMTVAFVMNQMATGAVGSERTAGYIQAVFDCLGVPTVGSLAHAGGTQAAGSLSLAV